MHCRLASLLFGVLFECALSLNAKEAPCPFDRVSLSFSGSEVQQAKCLLRPVQPFGRLGASLEVLPVPLERIVGQSTVIDKAMLREFLQARSIDEGQIGGSLDEPLSKGNNNDPGVEPAEYFVIHDTSTPNFLNEPFPSNINSSDWPFNAFARYEDVAHVFVNRVGASATKVNFRTPFRATKFETQVIGSRSKGRFLHVEMIQPRKRDPRGGARNDALAPDPGFTDAQLDRLALVYVAASTRRGRWLTPAFHAVLDAGLANAHDDPQRFDLEAWAMRLGMLLNSISGSTSNTIQIETEQQPVHFQLPDKAGIDRSIEASAVASLGKGFLLVADDRSNELIVVDLSGQERKRLSSSKFPNKPAKWEAMARDELSNFYVIGSHQSPSYSTLLRFRVSSEVGSWAIENVVQLDLSKGLTGLGFRTGDAKVEGLAVRVLKEGEKLRRELVIGLRKPPEPVRIFVADITSVPDLPEDRSDSSSTELSLVQLFTFHAGKRDGTPLELSSLEHFPSWSGFFIVTSAEDEDNRFHGNALWFVPDVEASGGRVVKPKRVWLFGPAEGEASPASKAEGLAVLETETRQEGHDRAILVLVYDNDPSNTREPSLLQKLTLVRRPN